MRQNSATGFYGEHQRFRLFISFVFKICHRHADVRANLRSYAPPSNAATMITQKPARALTGQGYARLSSVTETVTLLRLAFQARWHSRSLLPQFSPDFRRDFAIQRAQWEAMPARREQADRD